MVITFYSYKGGVGRTLAVANVAYLLATDESEPCRVLLWDFDLEGPGLQHVFKCKWRGKKQGFVDCVHGYLTEASLPEIEKFIHPTDVPGIDILPAGRINKTYSEKLEDINWRDVYREYRGYDFIENVRQQILSLEGEDGYARYDYVLVDSRTGYSDVGGICVQQLPNVVVLLFRLNRQNISGIQQVYRTIRAFKERPEGRDIDIVPVISPMWPFATKEANAPVRKAEDVFEGRDVLTITFEAALTFGERIITRDRADYPVPPPICTDYGHLADKLRSMNPDDLRTMWEDADDRRREDDYGTAFDLYTRLVRRRPNEDRYWRRVIGLPSRYRLAPDGEVYPYAALTLGRDYDDQEPQRFLDDWVQKHPEHLHGYLYRARYVCRNSKSDERHPALEDYKSALELAPDRGDIRLERARLGLSLNALDEAERDIQGVLEDEPDNAEALVARAELRVERGVPAAALCDYEQAFESGYDRGPTIFQAAQLAFKNGRYGKALEWVDKSAERRRSSLYTSLFRVHVLAALGQVAEARDELTQVETERWQPPENIVEALIVVGEYEEAKRRALNLLGAELDGPSPKFLQALAEALEGAIEKGQETIEEMLEARRVPPKTWRYDELRVFLATSSERGDIDNAVATQIGTWIDRLEEAAEEIASSQENG